MRTGADAAAEAIANGAAISVANWAKVLTKLAERGRDPEQAASEARKAEGSRRALSIEPMTAADCIAVARLRLTTRPRDFRWQTEPAWRSRNVLAFRP
jgi:hypothetical protein